jgi:hypothetical protein
LQCYLAFFVAPDEASFVNYFISLLIVFTLVIPLRPESGWASRDVLKRDTTGDGRIDQIAHFGKGGKLIKLEIDSNADEVMDQFQYYEDGKIKRVDFSIGKNR